MQPVSIGDMDDARLNPFRDLKRSNENRRSNMFVAEGGKLLDRMIEVGWPIVSVVLTPTAYDEFQHRIPPDVPIYLVEKKSIEELIGFHFHRGVLASGRRPDFLNLARLIPPEGPTTVLMLVDIHDPENVGNIIRTASSLGVSSIVMTSLCADPFSRRVLRTSMGGVLLKPIAIVEEPVRAIASLRLHYSLQTWATVLAEDAIPLSQAKAGPRRLIVVGNEGDGLSPECINACERKVTIPMAPHADSLNVAVASGIILYHFCRSESAVEPA
ncbi:RNA methyltransferase [bacterium]|nr:RNA methyltransferase [bacterium]